MFIHFHSIPAGITYFSQLFLTELFIRNPWSEAAGSHETEITLSEIVYVCAEVEDAFEKPLHHSFQTDMTEPVTKRKTSGTPSRTTPFSGSIYWRSASRSLIGAPWRCVFRVCLFGERLGRANAMTSGLSCPSIYVPFLYYLYRKPNTCSQRRAVRSVMTAGPINTKLSSLCKSQLTHFANEQHQPAQLGGIVYIEGRHIWYWDLRSMTRIFDVSLDAEALICLCERIRRSKYGNICLYIRHRDYRHIRSLLNECFKWTNGC